ncbi:hypothetical protein B0A48_03782 [Cryoendolithus antarcticus]|uniref:non-specific serine/threonine protein kinase n=1 Tax=Cryoendolithus antarcticus TaxID=1507870 RepID=A0A1V8TGI5_9PEZI|nr:hypothetical protein B0A48_03782 [Cryoendolithus antarcticus]
MTPEDATTVSIPEIIDSDILIEEETTEAYKPKNWYPVRLGEVLNDRYKVVGKLGYGGSSTIWLCRDLRKDDEYVIVKVYINNLKWQREIPIYEHIASLKSRHSGLQCVRRMLDSFEILKPGVRHFCLVHEALGVDLEYLRDFMRRNDQQRMHPDMIRQLLRPILRALHFLHEEAHIVHTDIQLKNILMNVVNPEPFARFDYVYLNVTHPVIARLVPSNLILKQVFDHLIFPPVFILPLATLKNIAKTS